MQAQGKEERKGGEGEEERGGKTEGNDCAAAAAAARAPGEATEAEARPTNIVVPTNTEDGNGGRTNQEQADLNINHNEGQGQETTFFRPDAFAIYSDDDTRMLTLLGLEPTANPNEGEQEDWRQLTGFTGLGRRSNEDEDGNRTTPRRTRLSVELHYAAFANMWYERGELDLDDDDIGNGQSPR